MIPMEKIYQIVDKLFRNTKEETIHWIVSKEDLGILAKDKALLRELKEAYACIEPINFKTIFIFVKNICIDFKTETSIMEKIVYSLTHELIHSFLKSGDEELVHSLTYLLNGESYLRYVPTEFRDKLKKIPVIDIE